MNTWSGLKTRKAGDAQSEASPPDPSANVSNRQQTPANISLQATSTDPARFPSIPPSAADAPFQPGSGSTAEGFASQTSPEASKSKEVIDRFGRLIQDWAKPSHSGPHLHGSPKVPSSPSVSHIIGQPPGSLRPPSTGGSAFSSVSASPQLERIPMGMREGGFGKWPSQLLSGIPLPHVGALIAAQEGVSSTPPPTASAPAEPSPAALPPAMSAPQEFDYRLPFSAGALEQRLRIPPGLEIARVIDARSNSQQPPAMEPSYYDFLQLETRPETSAPNEPAGEGHTALEMHHLLEASSALPFFHQRQLGLHRGAFKVPTVVPPKSEPEFPDHSPNQPDTPTNLGNPIAKDPDAWEDGPEKQPKPAQEETAGKTPEGGGDVNTRVLQEQRGGFRVFSGGLVCAGAHGGAQPGGPGLVAQRTWSSVPATSPPGSPLPPPSDLALKRAWETSGAADSLGKRPRHNLEHSEPRRSDFDRNELEGAEASARNDGPQEKAPSNPASEAQPAPDFSPETADGLGRQLADTQRQLSVARDQLSDAQRQVSDARQELADAQGSWEADRRQWRQKEAAWEALRTARMQPGGSPSVAGGGSPAVGRGSRYSDEEVGRLISERLIRTESMLIAALAEIGRLRAWIAGMRAAPRVVAAGPPAEASASGDPGRA